MVTVCVSLTLPVKLKLDGDTVTDTPAGASTTAFQVVATPRVLRKVRTQTHSPGQLVKRMLGKFRVRGFPPVLGSRGHEVGKGLVHHQTGQQRLAEVDASVTDMFRIPRCRCIRPQAFALCGQLHGRLDFLRCPGRMCGANERRRTGGVWRGHRGSGSQEAKLGVAAGRRDVANRRIDIRTRIGDVGLGDVEIVVGALQTASIENVTK